MALRFPVLALLALSLATPAARPQSDGAQKVYQRALKATTWIVVPKGPPRNGRTPVSVGSGSLIDRTRRLVITNYHVVGDTDQAVVLFPEFKKDGKPIAEREHYMDKVANRGGMRAVVFAKDPKRDLALLQLEKVPDGTAELRLAKDSGGPGQRVHSIGNPGQSGGLWLYTPGTVRQVYHKKWRAAAGDGLLDLEAQVIETDSATNKGDSGGPLLNDGGELVGVTQGGASDAQLLSVFIDVSEVKALLKSKSVPLKVGNGAPLVSAEKPPAAEKSEPAPAARGTPKEKEAATKLSFAKTLAADGKQDKARERLREIVQNYPLTEAAKEAKALLEKK